ncbi:hypothetical protein DAEQUDRAFT_725845 [Daedalea quercina L-15889]|uniref:Uncharacterized protein n=1 Tax=Daedalea quercina L-15889 TaxID=1314783 RepID=A0A165R2F6_9APHY|nr:hypothetical protein DAEQUDRAFT_725845 [Daedalea quercina L-15889]
MADVHFSRVLDNHGGSLTYDTKETENQDADGDDMGHRDERSPDFEMNVVYIITRPP